MKGLMKSLLGLALVAFAMSCSKERIDDAMLDDAGKANVNLELVKEVEGLPRSVVTLGYAKLSSAEKVVFWKRHVDHYLKRHPYFSTELVEHIQKLKEFAHVDLYDRGDTPEMRKYIDDFERAWYLDPIEKGKFPRQALTEASSFWGVANTEQTVDGLKRTVVATNAEASSCNCRYSLSCPGTQKCYENTLSCGPGSGAPADCGVFGNSRCDGKCS